MAYELQTLERALQLLSVLATKYPLRLTDLAEQLETNQTTVLRTLRVLERHGYVRRTGSGAEYVLGARLAELGHAATSAIDVAEAVRPWTSELAREFLATAHVGMLRANMVTVIAKLDVPESRVHYSTLGSRLPLHATAAGKAALAMMNPSPAALVAMVGSMPPSTPNSLSNVDQLISEIRQVRERHYSTESEEYQLGFACAGTAFRLGEDIYTVSISGPVVQREQLLGRGERLRDAIAVFLERYAGAVRGLGDDNASWPA